MTKQAEIESLRRLVEELHRKLDTLTVERDAYKNLIEKNGVAPAGNTLAEAKRKLADLTLKQHAALLCMVEGMTYESAAKHMQVDSTTVKLHIRAVCSALGYQSRGHLLSEMRETILSMGAEYKTRYGVGLKWWLGSAPSELFVRRAKTFDNQHTKKQRSQSNASKRGAVKVR